MKYTFWIFIFLLFAGCNKSNEANREDLTGIQSLVWTQFSAEAEALYYQGYNIAARQLREYTKDEGSLSPAIVLDLDETVLDNSAFNVNLLREGMSYSDEKWIEWCELRSAGALPGSLDFLMLADSLGFEIFYISNRLETSRNATIDNMKKLGIAGVDDEHLLLKKATSSKDERRAGVSEQFEIVLLLGDNLGDFDGIFDDRSNEMGKEDVRKYRAFFGTRFIIFPNVIYGSWMKAAFPEKVPDRIKLEKLRGIER